MKMIHILIFVALCIGFSMSAPTSAPTNELFFQTIILEKTDPLCNNTEFRCVTTNLSPHGNERRSVTTKRSSSGYGSSSNSNNNKNDDNGDDILPLTPAFMYVGTKDIPHIVQQFLLMAYGNETFEYIGESASHQDRRRSAYYWDWKSDVSCQTTRSGANNSVFTTTCSDSGRITQYCFSGDSTTYIKVNGSYQNVTFRDMEQYYGSQMITYQNGSIVDDKFMTFVHVDHNVITTFLKIVLNTTELTVTGNHLVYKHDKNCNQDFIDECMRVFSNTLTVGDSLFVFNSDTQTLSTEIVGSIETVIMKGIYSPMPESGQKFFVNNVLVSPYSTVNMPILNEAHRTYAKIVSVFN